MLQGSKSVVAGRIVASRQGFFRGSAMTLFAIDLDFSAGRRLASRTVLVPYSASDFSFEGERFCTRSNTDPENPQVGKGVLLFASEIEDSGDAVVLRVGPDDFVFESETGQPVLHRLMSNPLGQLGWREFLEAALGRLETGRAA
jgi:hypothetical protein